MKIEHVLEEAIKLAITELYQTELATVKLEITNSDFEGDYTFVVFPLLRFSKKKPEETAEDIGNKLL
ncbi:MAG: arginine--tRNA ligase, partial [Bacteroidia bacterium]|nr:arginine--tRNA ligase [Bacteroidia bacterium]